MSLMHCKKCGHYTLKDTCPRCGIPTTRPSPAKFSPQDRYGGYRRRLKLESMRAESDG